MRNVLKLRQIKTICYLIAACLLLTPMAHATFMWIDADVSLSQETEQPCHEDSVKFDRQTTMSHGPMSSDTECNHNGICKMHCSASFSALPFLGVDSSDQNDSNIWKAPKKTTLPPSFLTRLDKPPRS
jgi:hypothetical protein